MNSLRSSRPLLGTVPAIAVFLIACGPQPPKPGTPAFKWNAARDACKGGDYGKANVLLAQVAGGKSEFASQAGPLALLTSVGMANAYWEIAQKYEEGVKNRGASPGPFRKLNTNYKTMASTVGLQYLELAHNFLDANKDTKEFTIVFGLPEATFDDPPQYQKITAGQGLSEADLFVMEKAVVKREVMRSICEALGAPKDPAKAKAAFQNGEAKVPGPAFLLAVAKGSWDMAELFGAKKLNRLERAIMLYDEADRPLAALGDNKDAKDLAKQIADARKKAKL
jgi:hypothetical protein